MAPESQSNRGDEGRDQVLPDCTPQMDLGHILVLSSHLLPTPPQKWGSQTVSVACEMGKTHVRSSLSPEIELSFVGPEASMTWEER